MRNETIAIHGGYDDDPTTKAVAVPIYQTVAYAFDSADHGAALFNLETEGFRYTPHQQSDHRQCSSGGRGAGRRDCNRSRVSYRTGRAALRDRQPRRSWRQFRFRAAAIRHHPYAVRPYPAAARYRRAGLPTPTSRRRSKRLIDEETRGGLLRKHRQSGRQYLRYRGTRRHSASPRRAAGCRQHGRHADPAAADRLRRRYRRAFAHQIHGRTRHDARRRHCR